jgi:hypothetical protein
LKRLRKIWVFLQRTGIYRDCGGQQLVAAFGAVHLIQQTLSDETTIYEVPADSPKRYNFLTGFWRQAINMVGIAGALEEDWS